MIPTPRTLDAESEQWLDALGGAPAERAAAVPRLHELLVRIARAEVFRRSGPLGVVGPELDDIAHQAAADALLAITAKLAEFRGESKFTTWAYKFVIFEVASKVTRHHWRRRTVALDAEDWSSLPARLGMQPDVQAEWRELMDAVRRAVDDGLTPRQRAVFVAIVVNGVPLDVLVAETGSNRNAIYKMIFDARRKIRAALVADGYITSDDHVRQRAVPSSGEGLP